MPDLTARSAIVNALAEERDAHPWIIQTPPMVALIALSALGIPPDTTTDEVRAGLAALRILGRGDMLVVWATADPARGSGYAEYVAEADREMAGGASPAAAVNALAEKLERAGSP